jgi:hypothetical protein
MGSSLGAPPSQRAVDPTYPSRRQRRLENRERDLTLSWRQWFRQRYARYWYLLGAFLLDLLAAGSVLQFGTGLPPEAWQYALAIALVIVLAYPELLGYRRLWPPDPLE